MRPPFQATAGYAAAFAFMLSPLSSPPLRHVTLLAIVRRHCYCRHHYGLAAWEAAFLCLLSLLVFSIISTSHIRDVRLPAC